MLSGCQPQGQQPAEDISPIISANLALQVLLPAGDNYTWRYDGFVEYGHTMQLDEVMIDAETGEATYTISGIVDDASGGEAPGDYSIGLTYRIQEGQWRQSWFAPRMMDTPFEEIVLIQTPLEIENQWTQQVVNRQSGQESELVCTITQVTSHDGVKSYKVRYEDQQSGYYELRTLKEGYGVIAYTKVIDLGGKEYEIGYMLPDAFQNGPS